MIDTIARTGYTLRTDRCVIEVTARLLGLPLVRARFGATAGELDDTSMVITVDPASLRTATPLLGPLLRGPKGLAAKRFPAIRFEAQRPAWTGRLKVRQTECDLKLRTRVMALDDATIISARGRLGRCQPRTRRLNPAARFLGRRNLDIEIAVEFTP
jgi:polyisoprenoid-binding protein YceI